MKRFLLVLTMILPGAGLLRAETVSPAAAPVCEWIGEQGRSFGLMRGGTVLWRLNWDALEGKPYFHPVRTTGGQLLTWLRPDDHPWHLGVWFSWKMINGLNYWETSRTTGLCEGSTHVDDVVVTRNADWSARVVMKLNYHPPGQPTVLREVRTLEVSAPDAQGLYHIDWHMVFTAETVPVVLDRTPPAGTPGGKAWGGYAGLNFRSAAEMTEREALDSTGWKNTGKLVGSGRPARWIDLSGSFGVAGEAGVALLEHPQSWRSPNPFYVYMNNKFGAIKTAPIFHEPATIPPGGSITLIHRVLIHDGRGSPAMLDAAWESFGKKKSP